MAYTKTVWTDGATALSAEHMNNIENGIEALDEGKVDKVSGKALSDNNYTTAEKTKLAGIQAGAQVNPGAATTSAAGLMTAADKTKLNNCKQITISTSSPSGGSNGDVWIKYTV